MAEGLTPAGIPAIEMELTPEQIRRLQPFFEMRHRGDRVLIANLWPTGKVWALHVYGIPAERRPAIQKACHGHYTEQKKPKTARRRKP